MKKHLFTIVIMLSVTKIYAQENIGLTPLKTPAHPKNHHSLFKLDDEFSMNQNAFLRYDALTSYREGVNPIKREFGINFRAEIDSLNGVHYIKMYNLSIEDMFTHGLRRPNYVILEVKEPSKYRYDPKYGPEKEWLRKNGYCYELMMPKGTIKGIKIADENLEKLFNVKCSIQMRKVNTLVLFRTSTAEKFKASGGEMVQNDEKGIYCNVSMNTLAGPWYHQNILPFLDETNYQGLIDVNLDVNVKSTADIPSLRAALKRYDLDIREEMREIEMFVITELK